ncbi:head GIN domain-containing protein [Chloroflexota bacterium]
MKKVIISVILVFALLLSMVLSGCEEDGPIRIGSSEEVITEELDFTDFTEVDVGSAFEVEITRSDTFSVVINAAESLYDYVEVTKSGNELKIYLNPRHIFTDFTIGAKTLKAEISMPELRQLQISGASTGTITGFKSESDLDIEVSGASTLKIVDGGMDDAAFEVSGASRISGNLTADEMDIDISGASRVELSGSADELVTDVSGASKLDMENFILQDASIELSGASEGTLNVKGKVDAQLSGASRLYFYGNPDIGKLDVSGASTVKHK